MRESGQKRVDCKYEKYYHSPHHSLDGEAHLVFLFSYF
jgi:hypothetical protein